MNITPRISMTLAAKVLPGETSAKGTFTQGTALANILIPDDADQLMVLEIVLDPAAAAVGNPADLYLEPATGQAEIAAIVPAGWTATEFDIWANDIGLGTSVPVRDADSKLMGLGACYALAVNATGPVKLEAVGSTHPAWTSGPLGAGSALNGRDLLLVAPAGWAVAPDEQIKITNESDQVNTITIVVLGKQ